MTLDWTDFLERARFLVSGGYIQDMSAEEVAKRLYEAHKKYNEGEQEEKPVEPDKI